MDAEQIQKMIDDSITKATIFSKKKLGDTPTEALQLANKHYVDSHTGVKGYFGSVASDGTAVSLPVGWTSVKNGSGDYTVTHDLGTNNVGVTVNPMTAFGITKITAVGANSFEVQFVNDSGSTVDSTFIFILLK